MKNQSRPDTTSRLPVYLVITIVAINSLGIGLIFPVMPELLQQVGNVDIAKAAAIGGLLSLCFAAMQVLFGPLLGTLSDQYGRRKVLIASLAVNAIDYAILAVASTLWLFFVARIVSGVASATFAVANSTLADISAPKERAKYFGLTSAAFGLGFVLGPVAGGLLGDLGPRAPFIAAAVLCAIAAGICYFALPETLVADKRRRLQLADCIPLAAFAKLKNRLSLLPLVTVSFLDAVAGMVYPAVWAYFAIAQFGWSTRTVGFSLAAYGFFMVLTQAALVRVLVDKLGELKTATFGLTAGVTGFVALTTVSSGVIAFLLTPLSALRAVTNTAITALMSQRASETEQGELQGILAGVSGISTLVGIPLMTQVFAVANEASASNPWPGAPFAIAAVFSAIALITLLLTQERSIKAPTEGIV